MAIKRAFNQAARGQLTVAGKQRNVIVRLPAQQQVGQRIRGVQYSYGVDASAPAVVFVQGRLMVLKGAYEDEAAILVPDDFDNTTDLEPIIDVNLSQAADFIPFGDAGIYIPENTEATVILTAPNTSGDVQPTFTTMIGSLTVLGSVEGLPDPFKKLR